MPITTEFMDRIAEFVFDVAPVYAFDSVTWMSLPGIIAAAASNPEVNCVLIRAAEGARGFCGGVDIKEMQAHPERITVLNRGNYLTFKAIRDAEVPVVAAVHKFVIGGGIGMCGASDTIIAADDAYFMAALARVWACGGHIDWDQIWGGARRRRLSLPGYQFQRKRYFIERSTTLESTSIRPSSRKAASPFQWLSV